MKLTKIKSAPGRLSAKRSINLATVGEQKMNIPASLGGIVIVLLLAVAFSKFFVIDRLAELSKYQAEEETLSYQVEQCYARLEKLTGVENEYAHYTLEAMTEEELTRCDRVAIIAMMREKLLGDHGTVGWSVSGNRLTVDITGETLQSIGEIAKEFEESPIVDFCTVSRATKGTTTRSVNADGSITNKAEEIVTATINVYLQQAVQ